jgi:hypothetical protein
MDDIAAISRLYPVTTQNLSSFPGKQVFSAATARIHGSVWFANRSFIPTQAMQGVNVVARWINPATGRPSGRYAAASVSGFLFTGNAGNPITGTYDPLGWAYSQFGSNNPGAEGFFDLAGLEFPNGGGSTQYQLSVEAVDPAFSTGVGPYAPFQVAPSGMPSPVNVTLTPGTDVAQDIVMPGSAQPVPQWAASETWTAPAPIPPAGDWMGSLNGYGDCAYFALPAQANRTLSVAVTALDELGSISENKAQPVIGMWAASDPAGTAPPAFTSSSFNQVPFGLTRLDAQINTSTGFLVGIADLRGDGRPDYHYHAHVLYADSLSPPRVGVGGGPVTLSGVGFSPATTVAIGNSNVTALAVFAAEMILSIPAQSDGVQNITITDPVSGAFSTMTGALTIGAASTDTLLLLQGGNPPTPVGAQATNPVSVRAVASDGVTAVAGATIGWSATNGVLLSACGNASSCSVITDASGSASTWLTPAATGSATITATLAPGAYSSSKLVVASLTATSSSSDLGVTTPSLWIAQGTSVSVPLVARVLSDGVPQTSASVNFNVTSGSGSLSASSAGTNSNGYATVTLTLPQIAAQVRVIACVAPANAPCQPINVYSVPASQLNLQPVAGVDQVTTQGQAFQPLTVRVTDSSSPPNPVLGANVGFLSMVVRSSGEVPAPASGESASGNPAMPVVLSVNQTSVASDANGLASLVPSTGSFTGPLEVDVSVTAGTVANLSYVLQTFPAAVPGSKSQGTTQGSGQVPVAVRRPLASEEK